MEMLQMTKRPGLFLVALCLFTASGFCTAHASENVFHEIGKDVKHAGKEIGKGAKSAGKKVGHAGKKVGKDIGKAGKKVGKSISNETRKLFDD